VPFAGRSILTSLRPGYSTSALPKLVSLSALRLFPSFIVIASLSIIVITLSKPKLRVGEPKLRFGKPKLRSGKPKLRVGKPKLRSGNPKLRSGKPKLRGAVYQSDHPLYSRSRTRPSTRSAGRPSSASRRRGRGSATARFTIWRQVWRRSPPENENFTIPPVPDKRPGTASRLLQRKSDPPGSVRQGQSIGAESHRATAARSFASNPRHLFPAR